MTAKGQCVESEKIKGRFNHLLYSTDNSLLVGITDGLVLMVFVVDTRGIPTRTMEVGMITTCYFFPYILFFPYSFFFFCDKTCTCIHVNLYIIMCMCTILLYISFHTILTCILC